jgi:two-component system NtrC family sensor kinase
MTATDNRRVLIVDDNHSIHDDFAKVLGTQGASAKAVDDLEAALFDTGAPVVRDSGFELASAHQGREALDMVVAAREAGRPFALAFVDMRMPPGWDGLETIERVWKVDPDLQIVICSAYSDYSWPQIHARLGTRDALLIIKKPFDTIEIVQVAHAMTSKWSLAQLARARMEDLEAAVRTRTGELEDANRKLAAEIALRDKFEAELRLAQKLEAVGQLAAGVAHEINTPIQYVGDSLQFIREGALGLVEMARHLGESAQANVGASELARQVQAEIASVDLPYLAEEFPNALDNVQHGVARIAAIVRAMKELTHPGTRETAQADLNHALDNALQVTANAYRYVADVEVDYAPLPRVTCFPNDLNQVFLNLIVNAAQAMEDRHRSGAPRGKLRVQTRVDGVYAVVSISDTGGGIPETIRDRVFDAFFTTKEVGRGTGQGLAIARSIVVDRHGGMLTFDSRIGEGTTYHIHIPIDGPAHRASPIRRVAG